MTSIANCDNGKAVATATLADGQLVSVGDKILINWPIETQKVGQQNWRKVKVVDVKYSKVRKHESHYKYELCFCKEPELENINTRLAHLEWKPIKAATVLGSKRSNAQCAYVENTQQYSNHSATKKAKTTKKLTTATGNALDPETLRYILAPMVGASELAFRLLCRRYGARLAYTPMMNSEKFAVDSDYRRREFQTTAEDRPLVAHFAANNPQTLLAAAKFVEDKCDAIDLNLGCPQRVAYSGHFGSFLLDPEDRPLVLDIVRTAASNLKIPVFVKIRLLDTVDQSIELCQQLITAGAKLIAIHARYRVNLVGRTGPGARDGSAHLDQVAAIRETIRQGSSSFAASSVPIIANGNIISWEDVQRNLQCTGCEGVMSAEGILDNPALFNGGAVVDKLQLAIEYLDLVQQLQKEIDAVVALKTVVFHIRRMCKKELTEYQLLEDCIAAESVAAVRGVVQLAAAYRSGSRNFQHDREKEEVAAAARKQRQREESKRKDYEARMVRKAKREGRSDLQFYLQQGAEAPSVEAVAKLKKMSSKEAFEYWKQHHGQHCYAFHLETGGCPRDRTCAFLHADSRVADGAAYG